MTLNQSALWTDGRYFLQGDLQLDCNWILQKQGNSIHIIFLSILILGTLVTIVKFPNLEVPNKTTMF